MTQFRALRDFLRRPGEDVRAGEVLELDDAEAALLVALGDTVEPTNPADRARINSTPRIEWELPAPTRSPPLPAWVGELRPRRRA